jgi:crotonobetainyl-CoA:carnitine CoA-transferase CaiB-like acyl-CoA transferase
MSLSGFTVLDFSKLLPGPFCTQVLSDLGMRVIRVELPHWADGLREVEPKIEGAGYPFWMVNRGKESVSFDFRRPAGRAALEKMLAGADALVEGFRPGTMEKLGLGWEELRERYPKLVYLSLTGYARNGPNARKAAHDINFLAESGFLGAGDSNGAVSFPSSQIGDFAGAGRAATRLLAALLEREVAGRGAHVEVAMADVVEEWLAFPGGWTLATGRPFERGKHWFSGADPFYRLYETKDGRHLAVGALEPQFHLGLLRELGREDLSERAPEDVIRELEAVFRSRTLKEWTALLAEKDVCVSPVKTVEEAVAGKRPPGRAPGLGEHNRSTLRSFGLSEEEIDAAVRPAPSRSRRRDR